MASKRTYTWGVLLGLAALPGLALANQEVIKLTQDSKNWAMQAGNMQNQRYSALKQINKDNVKNLRVAWTMSTGVFARPRGRSVGDRRHAVRPQPVPQQSVRHQPRDQQIKWKYEPRQDPTVIPVMCCDNRQPRPRIRRRQDFPAAGRHQSRRTRRQDRQRDVEGQERRSQEG